MRKICTFLCVVCISTTLLAQQRVQLKLASQDNSKKNEQQMTKMKDQQKKLKEETAKLQLELKDNPLVQDWNTPYQTPPFDKIKMEHYAPAFDYAMKVGELEILDIALNEQKPTFENTIAAMDKAGMLMSKISGVFYNLMECNTSEEMQKLSQELSPRMTDYSNKITLNALLFKRVKVVYDAKDWKTEEQRMLAEKTYRMFVNNGALLSEEEKDIYRKLTVELAQTTLKFSENVLAATNAYNRVITERELLKGIPDGALEVAAEKAKSKGYKSGYLFDLSTPSYLAVMKYADNEQLRHEMFMAYSSRCYKDKFDNTEIVMQIVRLRSELAKLLGYEDYASYVLTDRMAQRKERVYELIKTLGDPSREAAMREMESLKVFASGNGLDRELNRWDFSYYSEKQKAKLFQFDEEQMKAYFTMDNVIGGVFGLAEQLYGLSFKVNKKISVYQKDVTAYEVYKDKKVIAILYLDFYPRDSKRGGAWMTSFRDQYVDGNGKNVIPLVSLVMNFTPATSKTPSLLTYDEVTTFMHEFGHALHGMLSNVNYVSLSGTSVPRDFVELPSQLNENWASTPEFLQSFAKHYKTGNPIPEEYIKTIKEMENFQAGYASCRQLSYALLDMRWHDINTFALPVEEQEKEAMALSDFFPPVDGTAMSTAFSHIFAGGYAAGYYSYKWAEVLDADAFSMFEEKGLFDKEVAKRFYDCILSKGGSREALKMFVDFRGREPQVDALLKRSGLK